MKSSLLLAVSLLTSVGALVLHKDTCDPTCDPTCGPLGKFSTDELEAELERRKTATGCTTTGAPTDAATTTGAASTTTLGLAALCTVQDGSGPSAAYPCTCGLMDGTGDTCHHGDLCTGGGGAPAPAPAAAAFVQKTFAHKAGSGVCSPPPDNFADELVDQADIPFEMLDKDKDGCLSENEMTDHMREQAKVHEHRGYYWQQKDVEKHKAHMEENSDDAHARADKDKSGCLNKAEYEDAQKTARDCPKQFMMMDHNADGKISRQEAATHVTEHLDGGNLNYDEFRAIFEAADINKDHYLTEQEFCDAGAKYQGDGNNAF